MIEGARQLRRDTSCPRALARLRLERPGLRPSLGNTHCIALPRIGDMRDDAWEESIKGEAFDVNGGRLPACAAERGAFMSDFAYERRFPHPYAARNNALYGHFRETNYRHAPRSAAAVPFAWMMKDKKTGVPEIAQRLVLGFRPEREPELGFDSIWVQERSNQLVMLDTFFGAIKPRRRWSSSTPRRRR